MRYYHNMVLFITILVGIFFVSSLTATAVAPKPIEQKPNSVLLNKSHSPADNVLRVVLTPETQSVPIGGTAIFNVVVLNVSDDINLVNVTVSDPQAPDCNRTIGNLAADTNFPPFQCNRMNVQAPFTNNIHVEGTNPINSQISTDDDSAEVEIIALDVILEASPTTLPEPGGLVDFSLTITNTGSLDVTLQNLNSPQYGNLTNSSNENISNNSCLPNPTLPLLAANGGQFSCGFSAKVNGQPDEYDIVVTAVATDENNISISESGTATVRLSDVEADLEVILSASPLTIYAPGSSVNFVLKINNTSLVDSINIGQLQDNVLENLNGQGDCLTPYILLAGETYTCSYVDEVIGDADSEHERSVLVTGTDDDNPNNTIERSAEVTILIVEKPEYIHYLPLIIDTVDEPNNICNDAFPLNTNTPYYFHANDQNDWYTFDLDTQGKVTVSLTNFIPVIGQIQVYKKDTCENLMTEDLIGFNGNHNTTKLVPLGTQSPGHYIIWIINDGITTVTEPYRLFIEVQ